MKITLEALQILDAIDSRGSFAAAAQALHRVPSALTHAVSKLERDLGFAPFERAGRRAVLTAAGRSLLEDGRTLLRAAGELECRARRIATGWENELRIALTALVDASLLFPLMEKFYRQLSGTRLRLSYEVLGGGWDALATDRADLAIGASGDAPPGGGYRTRPFGEVEFVFVVAPRHPLASAREPIAAAEIQRHRAVAVADTSRQLLARSSGLLTGQDVLTVPDMAAKAAAHVAGLGVGHLPRPVAEREAAAGRLLIKGIEEAREPVPLLLAWRSGHEGRALAWFLEQLEDKGLCARLLGARPPARRPARATRAATRPSR